MQDTFVIVGNALSAMVAAKTIADTGQAVTLVNDTNHWGGHFATLEFDGETFDAGMVLHEFTAFNMGGEEDVSTYNPLLRNDAGRFCQTVHDFVTQYQDMHQVHHIKMLVDGKVYDDLLIANHLTSLAKLPFAKTAATELAAIVNKPIDSALHAQYKQQSAVFQHCDFESVSLANHGETLHQQLIAPFCQKIFNVSTRDVVAYYHRVSWLPLFYPETLLSYLKGSAQALPETVFSYPTGQHVGDLVLMLRDQILAHHNITVCKSPIDTLVKVGDDQYELAFEEQTKLQTSHLAWAKSLGQLLTLGQLDAQVQQYDKASIVLVFATIEHADLLDDFSVLSIADPAFLSYRITNQTRCANVDAAQHKLVIELNADLLAKKATPTTPMQGETLKQFIHDELIKMRLISEASQINVCKVVTLKQALPNASNSNIKAFDQEYQAVNQHFDQIRLLGSASAFSSSSFNHQVIQGLQLAKQWSTPKNGPKKANPRVNRDELSYQ